MKNRKSPLSIVLLAISAAASLATQSQAASLTWVGGNGNWDVGITPNWNPGPTTFTDGDDVTFNAGTGTVTVVGTVAPGSMLFNNVAYTLGGSGVISGTGSLTRSSGQTLTISTTNSYTGATITNSGGVLQINSPILNGGIASGLGASSNAASNLVINGGQLNINTNTATTDRLFTIGATANISIRTGTTSFTNTGAIGFVAPNVASTLTLSSANVLAGLNFASTLTDNGTGVVGLTVANAAVAGNIFALTGTASTYTGITTFSTGNGQVVTVAKLANGGLASSIGAATSAATNWRLNGGTVTKYVGAGDSTNRNYQINGSANRSIVWEASGDGALVMSGTATYQNTNDNASTFTFTGSSAGNIVNQYNGIIANPAGLVTLANFGVIKTGTNTWALGGANTYTGTTSVNAGTLLINGNQSAATGAVSVAAGATLGGNGTVGGATTLADLAILAPGNSPGVLSFASTLTLAGGDTKVNLELATGLRGTNYDGLNVGGLLTYNGDLMLSIATPLADGTYDLFAFGSETGSFQSIVFAGAGPYFGPFVDQGLGVWTATSGGQNFTFTHSTGDLVVATVPEPSACLLLAGGLGLLACRRRHTASA